MKAYEWASKFSSATTDEEKSLVWDEFGKETAELIALRTKGTKDEQKLMVSEAAVREQRQKFRAMTGRVEGLTDEQFDQMLDKSCPEYRAWQEAKRKAEEAREKAKAKEQENRDGRTFADNRGRRPHNKGGKPQHHNNRRGGKPQQRPQAQDGRPVRLGDVPKDWVA